jgi:hypothetical protein
VGTGCLGRAGPVIGGGGTGRDGLDCRVSFGSDCDEPTEQASYIVSVAMQVSDAEPRQTIGNRPTSIYCHSGSKRKDTSKQ